MKVLHVSPSFFPAVRYGGPVESTLRLCQALLNVGVEVDVVTTNCDGPVDLPAETDHWSQIEGLRVWYFRRWPRIDFAPSAPLAAFLWREVQNYELVHINAAFSLPSAMAAWACRIRGVPYLVTPRGSLRKPALALKRWKKAPYWLLVEKANLTRAAAIHATSQMEGNDIEELGLDAPVFVVPNGVTLRPPQGGRRHPERVLFLGRLHPVKAVDRLLQAMSILGRSQSKLELLVAGPDDSGEKARLVRLLSGLEPRPAVTFLGPVGEEEKTRLLATAGALVLPSHTENFGLVVVEALAQGTPVVASRNTPWAELEASGAGRWVENDPGSLAEAIRSVLATCMEPRIGCAARELATKYAWTEVGRRMAAVYGTILHGPPYSEINEA